MRDAGVVWLQITGGEPAIDKDFADAYRLAIELGMMLTVSATGSFPCQERRIDFAYSSSSDVLVFADLAS